MRREDQKRRTSRRRKEITTTCETNFFRNDEKSSTCSRIQVKADRVPTIPNRRKSLQPRRFRSRQRPNNARTRRRLHRRPLHLQVLLHSLHEKGHQPGQNYHLNHISNVQNFGHELAHKRVFNECDVLGWG